VPATSRTSPGVRPRDLIYALAAYRKSLAGTPGKNDLAAKLRDLETDVQGAPDPEPAGSPPPVHGQTARGQGGAHGVPTVIVNNGGWPTNAAVAKRMKAGR
jgi:hypothetical protein